MGAPPRRVALLMLALMGSASAARAADAVTEWTIEADRLGQGGSNWHTLAIMHQAMHDAANAIEPRYERWAAPGPDEPPAVGAMLEAALAGAAAQVLVTLHPDQQAGIGRVFQGAINRLPPGPAVAAGLALGEAVGQAATLRRSQDGFSTVRPFVAGDGPGRWRLVPPTYQTSMTTAAVPFLFTGRDWAGATPPPIPGSPAFLAAAAEVRAVGALERSTRTAAQTGAAVFWAYQSSQRGFVQLAVTWLDSDPLPGGLAAHARMMSQLTAAQADGAILAWAQKERFAYWRPITVIQNGEGGVAPDPAWMPLIETPPHPEHPSGHATDCTVATAVLTGVFGSAITPVVYRAQSGMPQAESAATGMGQHAQIGGLREVERQFPDLASAARECIASRIWAGAHFRTANEEAARLGAAIAQRALLAVPPK